MFRWETAEAVQLRGIFGLDQKPRSEWLYFDSVAELSDA